MPIWIVAVVKDDTGCNAADAAVDGQSIALDLSSHEAEHTRDDCEGCYAHAGRLELNLKDGGALVVNKDPAVQQLHTSSSATGDVSYEYAGDQTWCAVRATAHPLSLQRTMPNVKSTDRWHVAAAKYSSLLVDSKRYESAELYSRHCTGLSATCECARAHIRTAVSTVTAPHCTSPWPQDVPD